MTDIEMVTQAVNAVASFVFLLLVGAILFAMIRRVRFYRAAGNPVPVLLKRGLALFGALVVIGGEGVMLRFLNIRLTEGSLERLAFTIQADLILLGALLYYAKTELFDVDDPELH